MAQSLLSDWSADDFGTLEQGVLLARHRLQETGLFSDEQLAQIIDAHPDEDLSINTMGRDAQNFEWREGDRNGVSGKDLVDLVRRGHLWLNCRKMLVHHPEIRQLVHAVYNELETGSTRFEARDRSANLLISSPQALVHYHLDVPVNMLWHLRGKKRVWVYPHFDFRFVPQTMLERICAGESSEEIPYETSFDQFALQFDVEPGQLLTWPQMAPHRVVNQAGLNVSLSTEHKNPTANRRINVHLANRLLRRTIGRCCTGTNVNSLRAHLKQTLARAERLTNKLFRKPPQHFDYPQTFKVDPTAEKGYVLLDEPTTEQQASPSQTSPAGK